MVHVLDILGCIAQGPTTESALEATPEVIHTCLRFLHWHGEAVELEGAFTTRIAVHVPQGIWLGNGDPTPGFAPDFQALGLEDMHTYLRRLVWLHADLLNLVSNLSQAQLQAEPEGSRRSIYQILVHVAGSDGNYLRMAVGKVDGLSEALKALHQDIETLPAALTHLWQVIHSRLEAMTEAERTALVPHGQVTWTTRRGLRRMLEHGWEHFLELSGRLSSP
jgi:uncharacterized damage-inducible protein DinB/predicted RNase H-like HicB family nuclease